MTKGKNKSKKNSNRRQNRPAQHRGPVFSQVSHTPCRFPAFPKQLQFHSTWSQTLDINLFATQYNRRVGLFSFNGQLPLYATSMYNLYRYCRIVGVHVKLTLAPDVTGEYSAVEMCMARVPFDEGASPTPAFLQRVRGSKYALTGSSAGTRPQVIQGFWGSFDELGNPVYDKSFWQTETEAGSTSLDPDEPVIAVAVRSVAGQTATVSLNLEVRYHMEFFDLHYDDTAVSLNDNTTVKTKVQKSLGGKLGCKPTVGRDKQEDDSFTVDDMSEKQPPRRR